MSSYHVGAHAHRLLAMISGRRVALVPNALDALPAAVRAGSLRSDVVELSRLGLDVTEVDLRDPDAEANLAASDLVWVRGGNVFVLRRVLADTGTDQVLTSLLRRDAIVYGGYSAGACVLAPDLTGLGYVDDVTAITGPVMTGLGLIDRPIVPHVNSPGHLEGEACDAVAARYEAAGQPHWALRDGDVLVIDGTITELLPKELTDRAAAPEHRG